jgi:hypothetical protein
VGAGQTSLGFGEFFGTSFATAANIGALQKYREQL